MQYRVKCGLAVCGLVLAVLPRMSLRAADAQRIAVVNVSKVFENYQKVPDIQKRIDAIHTDKKKDLEARGRDLAERNRELEQRYQQAGAKGSIQVTTYDRPTSNRVATRREAESSGPTSFRRAERTMVRLCLPVSISASGQRRSMSDSRGWGRG